MIKNTPPARRQELFPGVRGLIEEIRSLNLDGRGMRTKPGGLRVPLPPATGIQVTWL